MKWDVFISHASEDKKTIARPLAILLRERGFRVWLDEAELMLGDSLRQKIDLGLAHSRYGIVVLSRSFFEKEWPQRELNALAAKEDNGTKVILPVWHNLDKAAIAGFSPILADRLAVSTTAGIEQVAVAIARVLGQPDHQEGEMGSEETGRDNPPVSTERIGTPDPERTSEPPIRSRRFSNFLPLWKESSRAVKLTGVFIIAIALGILLWTQLHRGKAPQSAESYTLEQLPIRFSGLAGLFVARLPGLEGHSSCPEEGEAGCVVGHAPIGESPAAHERLDVTITCVKDGRIISSIKADPQNFLIPRLQPGSYTILMTGPMLDAHYDFGRIAVRAREATLMGIRVFSK